MKVPTTARALYGFVALIVTLFYSTPIRAEEWTTKGGSAERPGIASQPMGMLGPASEWWRMEDLAFDGQVFGPGQSATQPIVVGEFIYHLAGNYLWRVRVDSPEDSPQWSRLSEMP